MNNLTGVKPKLIVLDLDGTALNSDNIIPDKLQNILINLRNSSKCKIVLASGRSITSMKPSIDILGLKAPVITLNGGVIIDPISNKIYYEKNLLTETYTESLEILKKLNVDFVIFTASSVYAVDPSEITGILEKFTENKIKWVDNFNTVESPIKILFTPKSRDSISEIKNHTKHLPIDIIESGFSFTELVPKGVNKGAALQIVSEMLDLSRKEIIAFGDNENDIEMLQFAGTGAAMGNAPDHVKAHADIVTGTNDDNGIYNVLKKIFDPVKEEILT